MKKLIVILSMAAGMHANAPAQTILKPSVKSKTTFAIVVDQKSYEQAETEIMAYRASVENRRYCSGHKSANCRICSCNSGRGNFTRCNCMS